MTIGHVFMAMSLDGYIARADGGLDWLMKQRTDGEDHGYDAFMASVDGLVMGRSSFETVLSFEAWPYEKPVIVMSNTLGPADIPDALRAKVCVTDQTPTALMASLSREGWRRAYVDGGKIVQAFLHDGLIADLAIRHIPILLGKGIPLFGARDRDIDLQHVETRSYPSGLVGSRYDVLPSRGA